MKYCEVIRKTTMAFYTHIYAPEQVLSLLVITNSTQISREYEISGLSLSLSLIFFVITSQGCILTITLTFTETT